MPVQATVPSIKHHFKSLTDPRRRKVTYPLINVVAIAICAVISGADDFVAIAEYGRSKKKFLEKFLDLSAGIPSHDRFNAIFATIIPNEFEQCLLSWITALHEVIGGKTIAIDGKTLRRSFDKASSKAAIHMVSAWATANHITLAQTVVEKKSSEITAIPKLLKMIDLSGAFVTIDAMGCQVKIAQAIMDGGGTYVLAVKRNQRTLYNGIRAFFKEQLDNNVAGVRIRRTATDEKGHGRLERREYYLCPVPDKLADRKRWPGLKAIGMAVNTTLRNGKETREVRYYILNRYCAGGRFGEAVRSHWGIENSCHWQLDVTFGEDQCRLRKGHSDANFSILRRMALSLLRNNRTKKVGVKNKRFLAGLDDNYLLEVLFGA